MLTGTRATLLHTHGLPAYVLDSAMGALEALKYVDVADVVNLHVSRLRMRRCRIVGMSRHTDCQTLITTVRWPLTGGPILAEAEQPVCSPAAERTRVVVGELRLLCDFWNAFPECHSPFRKGLADEQ